MKKILLALFLLPFLGHGQTTVKVRASHEPSWSEIHPNNNVYVDSVLIGSGIGQGGNFKFNLVLFTPDCRLIDSLDLGDHDPFNSFNNIYHFRFNITSEMANLDSTLKYRIADGTHYFLYTPYQYRGDFVSSAYYPMHQTIDSLWGSQAANAPTVMILYGIKGDPSSHEFIIDTLGQSVITMEKIICQDAGLENMTLGQHSYFKIYPNPAKDTLSINGEINGELDVQIMDSYGRVVYSTILIDGATDLNISKLVSGVYFISLNDGQQVTRVIIE